MTISEASGEIRIQVDQITEKVKRQIMGRGTRAVNALRNAELETLNKPGHGRVYKKPGGGTYRASAPGEVPARRSGALRLQWNGRAVAGKAGGGVGITAELTSNTPYAVYLDSGTKKMAARPFVEKIKMKALPKIKAIYSEPYT